MADMRLLAELLDRASERHNGASGRRLADIAKADGFDVSHSTLNKIRKGTYTSEPTVATLRAIAHLARVREDKVLYSIKEPKGIEDAAVERAFTEWLNAWYREQNLVLDYARARRIAFEDAEEELQDVKTMFEERNIGRPWTPPWNPGPEFQAGEEPWKAEWWVTSEPSPDFPGAIRIGFGGWDVEKVRRNRPVAEGLDAQHEAHRRDELDKYHVAEARRVLSRRPELASHDPELSWSDFGLAAREEDDPKEDDYPGGES
ncbi:hypothetical protein [Mycobacterium paragordonae]|uniref:hypothetical protein n=1 Tax=Mycobacterium paragordonae TaxID=1389713 RepID=UPI003987D9F0